MNHEITNFQKDVVEKSFEKPVLVDFWAEWCGPCKMMGPVFEELSTSYTGKLKFAKLNVDQYQMLAGQYGIRGIPCLIVMKDGVEIDRIVGYAPKEMLQAKINEILSKV